MIFYRGQQLQLLHSELQSGLTARLVLLVQTGL